MQFCKTVFKNLAHKPVTRLEKRAFFEATRGHVVFDAESCIYCSLCARKCPADAIAVNRGEKSWAILRARCVQCASCVDACPKGCLSMAREYTPVMTEKEWETHHARVPDHEEDR